MVRTDNYDYCLPLHLGFEHDVLFTYCECEPLVVTMVRAHLWPSSPQRPNIAFTFDLLDLRLLEIIVIFRECHS